MGVVISILKILGIILLVILAVLILALLVILFVPVRYRAKGEVPAEGNPHGIVRVTWLLHLASFRLEYDSGKYENSFHWDFRILGIPFRLKQRAAVPKKKTETAEEEANRTKHNNALHVNFGNEVMIDGLGCEK